MWLAEKRLGRVRLVVNPPSLEDTSSPREWQRKGRAFVNQGLTRRSRGRPKGCAFCPPLTSNVRPHVKTHRFVSIERRAKRSLSKAARVLLVHCWSRPPKRSHQEQSQLAFATHRSQSKACFRSALALEAPANANVSHSVGAAAMRGSGFSPRSGLLLLRFGHANHRQSFASRRSVCVAAREA